MSEHQERPAPKSSDQAPQAEVVDEASFDDLFRQNDPPTDEDEDDKGGCNTAASASGPKVPAPTLARNATAAAAP